MPTGATPQPENTAARRQVAGGPTADDLSGRALDEELAELLKADQVLFAKPLAGIRPGWSWDAPEQLEDGAPDVVASGLPPRILPGAGGAVTPPLERPSWIRTLAMPDLPVRLEARVIKYLEFYRDDPRGQRIARVWAKKSGRLTPALKAECAKAGIPTDLAWLSLIESGHNPTAVSPAGAAGLWQFIPDSARMYGLTVDRWVDERLDPQRATDAAIRYLKDLRSRFGNWELAMAGYNMGHGGLLRAMRKFNTNDFWTLSQYEAGLPWETSLYVPKILAIAIVMNNRNAFGIGGIQPEEPISFDTVYVDGAVPLSEVARAAQVSEEEVVALNAHYLAGRTPPAKAKAKSRWPVRVPAGRGLLTSRVLAKSRRGEAKDHERYVVRFGDTPETIARSRKTSVASIQKLNRVSLGETLDTGTILLVPKVADGAPPASEPHVVVVPPRQFNVAGRRRLFYDVRVGDSVEAIATAFDVTASELLTWNGLDGSASLQPEMVVQIFAPQDFDVSRVRSLQDDDVQILVAGSDEFSEYFEGLNNRRRIVVAAHEGDTLTSIGRRYSMSSGMMERINRFSRSKKLKKGDRVVVYARAATGSRARAGDAEPLPPVEAPNPEALPSVGSENRAPNGRRAIEP